VPKYVGKGENFYLVTCSKLPPQGTPTEKLKKFHEICMNCGFYKDATSRQMKAIKQELKKKNKNMEAIDKKELQKVIVKTLKEKKWKKLVCVHPTDKTTLAKWKQHLTS